MIKGTQLDDYQPRDNVTELETIDISEGQGQKVKSVEDTVTAHYTGALASTGKVFQSSHDMGDAITFPLNQVIAGWQQGVVGMKVGGRRRLIIPADQAYGANSPSRDIPAYADLVFDIELVNIK